MFSKQIGIDLGTATVLVYVRGKGVVLNEPSVVAISNTDNRIMAVGEAAKAMLGRTPGSITVSRPMRDGVIADYVVTEAMLRYFIGKVCGKLRLFRPEVMVCIPAGVTSVEQRAVHDATLQAGAKVAYLIEEPLAAAIGANIPIHLPNGNMVVDIGGGTAEAAVISLNGIVVSSSVRVAGNKMETITSGRKRRKYNLMIGERMAEEIKIQIGSALPLESELTMEVRGRDQVAGLPKTIVVNSGEIREAISEPLEAIIDAIKSVLAKTPPELSSDVIDRGLVLTGGGSLLRGIDRLITKETGVPAYIADNPIACVAIGAGLALERLEVIRKNLPSVEA
ncbi:MAG: rod shape-determining protein [Chloroflexi bacterium]|nr:rod shape-determining protein [Chloroflexota bacterium]